MSARRKRWPRPRPLSSAKVPEPLSAGHNLYTIPPSAPFLTTLARAVLAGELPLAGRTKARPADALRSPPSIYPPAARRARYARRSSPRRNAMLCCCRASGRSAIRMRRPPSSSAPRSGASRKASAGAPVIGELQRRIALMQLVLAFGRMMRRSARRSFQPSSPLRPAQASSLAADLARLMDDVEREEIDFSRLAAIVPEEFAGHWQLTVDFLKIVTEQLAGLP